eukprot:8479499-Pyramimonas_sp.AAC.1
MREAVKIKPRAEADADTLMSAEELAQEDYESLGWEFCIGTEWARPQRLGLCRLCSALDDWN